MRALPRAWKGVVSLNRTQRSVHARPHRLRREDYRGEIAVAFTVCVAGRARVFEDSEAVRDVVEILGRTIPLPVFIIPIYCFMPDHLHLILLGQEPQADAWEAMVRFKQQTGYWFHLNRPGVLWQKGFCDHIIRSRGELTSQVRYVADNPVRKGLVGRWNDYPYSGSIGFELSDVVGTHIATG